MGTLPNLAIRPNRFSICSALGILLEHGAIIRSTRWFVGEKSLFGVV